MPIGKNSLKRVTNNGYSKVQSSSPDMENSEVSLVGEAAEHAEKILAPKTTEGKSALERAREKASAVAEKTKKSADAKTGIKQPQKKESGTEKAKTAVKSIKADAEKSLPKKPIASKKSSPIKEISASAPKKSNAIVERGVREGEGYVNLGGSMPYYLL